MRAVTRILCPPTCGLALLLTACGSPSSGPTVYVVGYVLSASQSITFDSVRYEDAQGTLVRVVAPPATWSVVFSASPGSYVQATAWAVASASGASAKLKATWTINGISTASDSSSTRTTAPGRFALFVTRRRI